jgi:hypothetical protein
LKISSASAIRNWYGSSIRCAATSYSPHPKDQSNIGVTSNVNQGDTIHDHRKTKASACAAMNTQLAYTNAVSIITSEDHAKYDIVVECLGYQQQLARIKLYLQMWDITSVSMMPFTFRPSNPDIISGPYSNVLEQFREVPMDRGCAW